MLVTLEKSQNFTYYAGIMLDAFAILLCSKLCWHNWLKPSQDTVDFILSLWILRPIKSKEMFKNLRR